MAQMTRLPTCRRPARPRLAGTRPDGGPKRADHWRRQHCPPACNFRPARARARRAAASDAMVRSCGGQCGGAAPRRDRPDSDSKGTGSVFRLNPYLPFRNSDRRGRRDGDIWIRVPNIAAGARSLLGGGPGNLGHGVCCGVGRRGGSGPAAAGD